MYYLNKAWEGQGGADYALPDSYLNLNIVPLPVIQNSRGGGDGEGHSGTASGEGC